MKPFSYWADASPKYQTLRCAILRVIVVRVLGQLFCLNINLVVVNDNTFHPYDGDRLICHLNCVNLTRRGATFVYDIVDPYAANRER